MRAEAFGLFESREVLTLQVLDQRNLIGIVIADDRRNDREAGGFRRSVASLARHDQVTVALAFDDDRLKDSPLPHRLGQLGETLGVDETTGLLRVGMQLLDGNGREKDSLTTRELTRRERNASRCSRIASTAASFPHHRVDQESGASERRFRRPYPKHARRPKRFIESPERSEGRANCPAPRIVTRPTDALCAHSDFSPGSCPARRTRSRARTDTGTP